MLSNEEIYFDEVSGISIEEQKEILFKINKITETNRKQLTETAETKTVKANKKSSFFPLIVNAAAILILCASIFILVTVNGRRDIQVREGSAVFDLTERALIEQIRIETAALIMEKEKEISLFSLRLEDVDAQLAYLYSSTLELTAEQLAAEQRLLAAQSEYRANLNSLHEERAQILENSRTREAALRAQLEERSREFAAAQQRTQGELDLAVETLAQLSSEQERIAAIDSHLAGGIAAAGIMIENSQYEQAAQTVENLINFNNNNVFAASRAFAARREFYNQTLSSLERAIVHLKRNTDEGENREQWDLQIRNIQLEETITEMQRTLDAFAEGAGGLATRINELEESAAALRFTNSELETSVAERENTIAALEAEREHLNLSVAGLNQSVADLRTVTNEQDSEISNLRSQLEIIRQALQQ